MQQEELSIISILKSPFKDLTSSWEFFLFVTSLAALAFVSTKNFLMFHSLAESYAVLISISLFIVNWNIRQIYSNPFLMHISIGLFFVGILDGFHLFAYKGMGVFPMSVEANMSNQLWMAARYLQAAIFVLTPFFLKKKAGFAWAWIVYGFFTLISIVTIWESVFPDCFVVGSGATRFKVVSEYIVSALFFWGAYLVYKEESIPQTESKGLLALSLLAMSAGEIFFTRVVDPYDAITAAGLLLKIFSFYLVYRSAIKTNLIAPFSFLMQDISKIKQSLEYQNEDLQKTLSDQIHNLNFYKFAIEKSSIFSVAIYKICLI